MRTLYDKSFFVREKVLNAVEKVLNVEIEKIAEAVDKKCIYTYWGLPTPATPTRWLNRCKSLCRSDLEGHKKVKFFLECP
jgi:hypothetical protein